MAMIYLDNAATTRPCEAAVEKITALLRESWGNPSSLHTMGLRAEEELTAARRAVATRLACREDEVFFTSGGTEANNLALFGAAEARKRLGGHIVTTAIEHSSVFAAAKQLERGGWRVTYLKPGADGNILAEQVAKALTDKTVLVSMMAVNNETGAALPVESIGAAIGAAGAPALLHIDAVQAFGKLAVSPRKLGADLLTVSAHKIHGPKGVGALYVKHGVRIAPRVYGGGQERGLRPGTEAAPLIAGFGAAVGALPPPEKCPAQADKLNALCRAGLAELPGVAVNSPAGALADILNFSCGAVRAETMLHFLAAKGIYISSGSACAKGAKSHVLTAMGLPAARVNAALRVSFCRNNTEEDVRALLAGLREGLATLACGNL